MKVVSLILVSVLACFSCLGQEFILVFLNKRQHAEEMPADQLDKVMEGHLANITRLAKEGKLWAAGPFDGGGGIFIFKSTSKEQVKEWLRTDPGIQANRWDIELHPYYPRFGSVCALGEAFEMTSYYFFRFTINLTKYSIGALPDDIRMHNSYMKQLVADLDVVAEGSLGDQEGSILVLREEPSKERLENDPAVQKGSLDVEVKKLHIAKGSFCEARQ